MFDYAKCYSDSLLLIAKALFEHGDTNQDTPVGTD